MIVEDADGNDIDLHDLDDDRDPEPPDEYAWLPVDPDEVADRIDRLRRFVQRQVPELTLVGEDLVALQMLIGEDLPSLVAEVRDARAQLERWRALHPMGRSYALTEDGHPPNAWHAVAVSTVGVDQADAAAAERRQGQGQGPTPWVQITYTTPWQRYEPPPPF